MGCESRLFGLDELAAGTGCSAPARDWARVRWQTHVVPADNDAVRPPAQMAPSMPWSRCAAVASLLARLHSRPCALPPHSSFLDRAFHVPRSHRRGDWHLSVLHQPLCALQQQLLNARRALLSTWAASCKYRPSYLPRKPTCGFKTKLCTMSSTPRIARI